MLIKEPTYIHRFSWLLDSPDKIEVAKMLADTLKASKMGLAVTEAAMSKMKKSEADTRSMVASLFSKKTT